MNHQGVIGSGGGMPWYIPAELRRFKQLTMGSALVMGRKTWESLPGILPGRPHIVVSRSQPKPTAPLDVVWHQDLNSALQAACDLTTTPCVFIIGGGEIYAHTMNITHIIYLTKLQLAAHGDVRYPIADLSGFKLHRRTTASLTAYPHRSTSENPHNNHQTIHAEYLVYHNKSVQSITP